MVIVSLGDRFLLFIILSGQLIALEHTTQSDGCVVGAARGAELLAKLGHRLLTPLRDIMFHSLRSLKK